MAERYTYELERVEDLDSEAIDAIASIMAEIILNSHMNTKPGAIEPVSDSFQFGKEH